MSADLYIQLKKELDKGKKAVVITETGGKHSGEAVHRKLLYTEDKLSTSDPANSQDVKTINKARHALKTGNIQFYRELDDLSVLAEPYFPEPKLIILGGGNIARPLAEFGAKAGYQVTVVDDRPMYARRDQFPDAESVICESFESSIARLDLNEYSFVVIMIREHRHDMDCLKQLLYRNTAYVGMIGSKHSVETVKARLAKEGCTKGQIDRINAPVGIKIGAVTPEEIAISIIAQIISCRRLKNATSDDTASVRVHWPAFDRSVLSELCKDTGEAKALVTIVATEGSVPGKAGSKMLVWPYGMTVGSIGGGYAEGEIINAAWQVIRTGASKIHDIDMTGQIAEEEGMVCGGIMRALIEDYSG